MATKRIALSQRYKFDARQTADLVNVIFATSPDVQAQAKLNLSARLEYPGRTLDLATTEAQLTQEEILYIVSPKTERGEERKCLKQSIIRTVELLNG
jgi:hypothetical protein